MTKHTASCDCGWTGGPYRSAKQADYALARHSCDKQRRRDASRARRLAREATVDKSRKPCLHKQARHEHGTHACYVLDSCRCPECTASNTAYERQRMRAHAYGRFTHWVDAAPVREHVLTLRKAGLGLKRVGELAGYSQGGMTKLVYGANGRPPSKRIRTEIADRILSVKADIDTLADGAVLDGTGTRRRIQALMANGWSMSQLAHRLGYEVRNFTHLAHGRRDVTARTARNVRALYDELWDVQPPQGDRWERAAYTRTINYAREREWLPPLAWDDDSIDDGSTRPWDWQDDEARTTSRGRPVEDLVEDVEFLLQHDPLTTAAQLAERLGYKDRSAIQNALDRAGRRDLLDRLARNADLAQPGRGHTTRKREAA